MVVGWHRLLEFFPALSYVYEIASIFVGICSRRNFLEGPKPWRYSSRNGLIIRLEKGNNNFYVVVSRESRPLPTSSCSVGGAGVGERETGRVMNIILGNRWRLMSKSTLSM